MRVDVSLPGQQQSLMDCRDIEHNCKPQAIRRRTRGKHEAYRASAAALFRFVFQKLEAKALHSSSDVIAAAVVDIRAPYTHCDSRILLGHFLVISPFM